MKPAEGGLLQTLPAVVLPEGYRGKILLVCAILGEQRVVLLRAGDLWHREILRGAEAEIRARFPEASVGELGGAFLSFEQDGSILIWGGSDEFGACDHEFAAELIRAAWPGRRVTGIPGERP